MKISSMIFIVVLQFSSPLWAASDMIQLTGWVDEKSRLENQKVLLEIRKLEIENDKSSDLLWGKIILLAPLVVALIGFLNFLNDRKEQNKADINQRKAELKQRKAELEKTQLDIQRSFDQKINTFFRNIGSDSENLQVGAAFSLLTVLQSYNKEHLYLDTIFNVVTINLKTINPLVQDILTRVLEKTVRLRMNCLKNNNSEQLEMLNFSRTCLIRPNFENLNFMGVEVDIAFADLTLANLKGTNLYRLRGFGTTLNKAKLSRANLQEARLNEAECQSTQFHDSNLVSATFKKANLKKTQFMRAKLQSAHFEEADIRGAKFEGADLNDAYFYGALLDTATKYSLLNAKNWRKAHFDITVAKELFELEELRHRHDTSPPSTGLAHRNITIPHNDTIHNATL